MVFGRFADRGCDGLCVRVSCASGQRPGDLQCVAHLGDQICSLPRHLCFWCPQSYVERLDAGDPPRDFRALPTGYRRTTVGDPAWPWPQRRGRRAVRPPPAQPRFGALDTRLSIQDCRRAHRDCEPRDPPAVTTYAMLTRQPWLADVFILSLKAGGIWWNPAVENQATDRAFRIGQHRNVLVHKFVTSSTIEEKIELMLAEKRQVGG